MKYFLNFIEEMIQHPDYEGYRGGRVEVIPETTDETEHEYTTREYRFFTNSPLFEAFREEWDFKTVDEEVKDTFLDILKTMFYEA